MNCRWFLVRHGETAWNDEGRAQGQADTALNAKGRAQAELAATRLAPLDFEAAYSSDLQRVAHTAEAIMRGRNMSFTKMVSLREKAFGEWEGLTFEQVERNHPSLFRRLFDEDVDFAPPGGESDIQLYTRMKTTADELLTRHADSEGNILIAGHGGSLRGLIAAMLGMPAEYMWRLRLSNCGITVINTFDGGAALDLLNDTSHLEDVIKDVFAARK
ncbi:MAG: histidine phosphatase family protein [Chloroflexi bacterium]|nr:histidine phosphatase family protein [Chloroflexota bacterium]